MKAIDIALDKIHKWLEALETIHTRYTGQGDRGETGPAGKDGRDSTVVEVNMLREQRNQVTEELNAFRRELHDYRIAVCAELRQLYDEYAERLVKIYRMEVDSTCEKRDKA
jgi:hypothetical protein